MFIYNNPKNMKKTSLSLVLAFVAVFALVATAKAETINVDTTWSGEVVVSEDVVITNGARLTIGPETTVKMDASTNFLLTGGHLDIVGEAGKQAVITSAAASPSPSDWGHILLSSPSSTLSMDHAKVEYAGGGGLSIPAYIMVQSAGDISIDNSDILNNNGSILVYAVGQFSIHNSNIHNPDFCQDTGGDPFCGSSIFNMSSATIDATSNYWGSNEGPTLDPAGDLKGTILQGNIDHIPFLTIPYEPEIPDDDEEEEDNDCCCRKHWWLRHKHHKHKHCRLLRGPWGLIKQGRVEVPDCIREKYSGFYERMEEKRDKVKRAVRRNFRKRGGRR